MTDNSTAPAEAEKATDGEDEAKIWAEIEAAEAGAATPAEDRDAVGSESSTETETDDDESPEADPPESSESAAPEANAADDDESGDTEQGGDEETSTADADPLATASPELRKMIEDRDAEIEAIKAREINARKREGATQRKLQELLSTTGGSQRKPAQQTQDQEPKPAPDQDAGAGKSDHDNDQLALLRDEYPDFGPLIDKIEKMGAGQEKSAEVREILADAEEARQDDVLHSIHPDGFAVISNNPEAWSKWHPTQAAEIQSIIAQNRQRLVDGSSAARVVTEFKAHLSQVQGAGSGDTAPQKQLDPTRKARLDGATGPNASGRRRPTQTGIPKDGDEKEIWDLLEAEEQAARRAEQAGR